MTETIPLRRARQLKQSLTVMERERNSAYEALFKQADRSGTVVQSPALDGELHWELPWEMPR